MTYKEIAEIAKKNKVENETIDKDWILGHFLNAMFSFSTVFKNFVFKGGTCLKKCYFENYRFSEDLDFTLRSSEFIIDEAFFNNIISKAEKNSGAKFYLKEIKPQKHNNIPQGYEVSILFWGAYHKPNQAILPPERWHTKIKLDISFSEKVILEPEIRAIIHSYKDAAIINKMVPCYPLNEIVAEKMRALIQRNRPRDIYDLYFLSSIIPFNEYNQILSLLKQKSESKNVNCCKFNDFINESKYKKNKRAWNSSLAFHLPKDELVEYEIAFRKVENFVQTILN